MTTPENPRGAIVAEAMRKAGVTHAQAAAIIGRSSETLRRRLRTGAFTAPELHALAVALRTKASDIQRRAEDQVA